MTHFIPKFFFKKSIKNYHNTFSNQKMIFESIMVTILDLDTLFQNYFRFFKNGHKKVCPIFKTPLTF